MTTDSYVASTSRDAYFPGSSNALARLWTREKTLHDWADMGAVTFFEGSGSDPTALSGYAIDKLWLRVSAGVTSSTGEIRAYVGGTVSSLSSWPVLSKAAFAAHIGGSGGDLDYAWAVATSGDPGTGKLLVNNATLASVTSVNISKTGRVGQAFSDWVATFGSSTASVRGTLTIYGVADTSFLTLNITSSLTDNSTYYTVPVTHLASGGSFAADQIIGVRFARAADAINNTAMDYEWATATSGNPGSGKLLVNNASLASATALHISKTGRNAESLGALIATWDDSTSTIKGRVNVRTQNDPTEYLFANVTSISDQTTYYVVTISVLASNGTPAASERMSVGFVASGDQGNDDNVQRVGSADYSYQLGHTYSSIDSTVTGSWTFDGVSSYPNKLGVTGTKPVDSGAIYARVNDTYTSGTADVAAIIAGYDNVNNALAGLIASQHSMLYMGADHASIFGGSLHTIKDDTDYSVILGGTNNLIEERGRYAAIISGDGCKIETAATDATAGFRGLIITSSSSTVSGRNGAIIGSVSCTINGTYCSIFAGETVTITSGAHVGAGGNGITIGATTAANYTFTWGLTHTIDAAYSAVFGREHVIASGHDYSSAFGIGCVTPFAGAQTFASRQRGSTAGRNMALDFQCSQETTDTTTTRLSLSGSSTFPTQPDSSIVNGFALVTGVSDAGVCSSFEINFVSERIGSGTPTLRQNATTVKYDGLALPTDPTMNVTSGGVYRVQVVGLVATNIRWNARIVAEQIVYT